MNNEKLLVSSEQLLKALYDVRTYCKQCNDCNACKVYDFCLERNGFSTLPVFWELEKIKK